MTPLSTNTRKYIILNLHALGCIKFGSFKLKSGIVSPIYIDLRVLNTYPQLLKLIADEMYNIMQQYFIASPYEALVGIPYASLPVTSYIAIQNQIPLLVVRKEKKEYGTGNAIDGMDHTTIKRCMLLDDILTTGASFLETIAKLEQEELLISGLMVIIDREQGGESKLRNAGYNVKSLFKVHEILDVLLANVKIEK
jgi:uridine monophosphate synthetase